MKEDYLEFITHINDRIDNVIHASYIPIPSSRSLEYTISVLKDIHLEINRFIEGMEDDMDQ